MQRFKLKRVVLSEGFLRETDGAVTTGLKLNHKKFTGMSIDEIAYVPIVEKKYPDDSSAIEISSRIDKQSLKYEPPKQTPKPMLVLALQDSTIVQPLSPASKRDIAILFGEQPETEAREYWRGMGASWAQTSESFLATETVDLSVLEVPEMLQERHERAVVMQWLKEADNALDIIIDDDEKRRSIWGFL